MKTLEQIKQEITDAKNAKTELDALNSTSKVSIWALIRDTVATVIWTLYTFFEEHKKDMERLAKTGYFGTSAWFVDQILNFQYGYTLELIDGEFVYAEKDEEAKIVQQVALETLGEQVDIKVAKFDDSNELTALNSSEKQALKSYVSEIKFPGMFINIISREADLLNLNYRVYYNALRGAENVKSEIEAAIKNYLNTIVFNGVFDVVESIDQIQEVRGVVSPYLLSANGRPAGIDIDKADSFSEFYHSKAGYMKTENLTIEMRPSNV